MGEIRVALTVGKEVTTHTDAVSVPGWSGAGYIIVDPETGVGAYKIGGGENGVVMFLAGYMAALALLSLILLPPGVGSAALATIFTAIVVFALSFAFAASAV